MRTKILTPIVLVGALGYFVDIYDLVLFSILRTASLKGLGVPEGQLTGVISQWIGSRKKVVLVALAAEAALVITLLTSHGFTAAYFYGVCVLLGLATGYWAVFVTMASEQFGTNLRATVTTTVSNFVRGSVVVLSLAFRKFQGNLGLAGSALAVFSVVAVLALIALACLDETHSRDLNYLEA